jgi:anaerobic magnesium-protoporphyrin IX monomethyl ester cyclase
MKILLANPLYKHNINGKFERYYIRSGSRWPHSGIKTKGTLPHYLPFPFSLAYSASLLKESLFDVHVIDAIAEDISEDGLMAKIENIKPDLIFYEITTPTADYDLLLAKKIKEKSDAVVIVGGAHASFFAQQILAENEAVDFVLKGEYEYSLLAVATSIRAGSHDFPSGSLFRRKGEVIDNGYPVATESLDALPFPLREIFPSNGNPNPSVYWDGFCQHRPLIQMQSSRGCCYKCYFCLWNQVIYNNGKYRTFSPKRVVDEMTESLTRYRAKEIYFDDDSFTLDKKHAYSICEELLMRGLKVKWSCMADAINLTEDLLKIMAESGCVGIKFGIESGSEKILKTIDKPIDLKKVKSLINSCKKLKIKTQAAFTVGLLGETLDDIKQTVRCAYSLDADSIQVSRATPFPGTKFYNIAKEKGLLKNVSWREYDGKSNRILCFSPLDNIKAESLRRGFLIKWFLKKIVSPFWWLGHIHIIVRTLRGWGNNFLSKQIIAIVIDEVGNR